MQGRKSVSTMSCHRLEEVSLPGPTAGELQHVEHLVAGSGAQHPHHDARPSPSKEVKAKAPTSLDKSYFVW